MAKTTEKTRAPETELPPVQPEAQLPAAINRAEAWQTFKQELEQRADEIGSQLPPNVTPARFIGASVAAVKANPDILLATPRSLFSAVTKAAQDGLLPDGREGIITVYHQKVRGSNPERREWVAQWNPMFFGIRKRARELDGIIIDAQVVIDGDEFDYELGDRPFIKHKPKVRADRVDAASGVAVYAIFRADDDRILHREVMFKPDVFDVMNQSRAKDSLMWTTFWTEGWRKTVGRRGSKSVPMSAKLEQIIHRDDENFDFAKLPSAKPALPALPEFDEPPRGGPPAPVANASPKDAGEAEQSGAGSTDEFNDDGSGFVPPTPDEKLDNLRIWLEQATTPEGIEDVWSELDIESEFTNDEERLGKAVDMYVEHTARVNKPSQRTDEEQAAIDKQVDDLFPGARGS